MTADIRIADGCMGCGACVRDCPMRVLEVRDGRAAVHPKKTENCIGCQHCVAVCPKGLVSFGGTSAADCKPLAGLDLPSAEQLDNLMVKRRSIRQFKKENIDRETIDGLLKTLANVPTGCNASDLTFTVVDDMDLFEDLRGKVIETIAKTRTPHILPRFIAVPAIIYRKKKYDEFFRNAPHMLIVSAGGKSTTPHEDCVATLAYFSMLAEAHGIGTTWCGYLKLITDIVPQVKDLFGIPRDQPYYAMLFGRPAARYFRTVNRGYVAKVRYLKP